MTTTSMSHSSSGLVKEDFPLTALTTQHKMRPEISRLLRGTYPQLRDHESVQRREALRGVARNMVFIDHRVGETKGSHMQSKTNVFEADMIVATIRYLLQQGYQTSQLVVLTPYLGQLVLLQRKLASSKMGVLLEEMDIIELGKAELFPDSAEVTSADDEKIRVATIDNYQGEEADVVVLSLVRSNREGHIGFLKWPERVNVMLSRARNGMILIGNGETLQSANSTEGRRLWESLLTQLTAGHYVFKGLPVVCTRHETHSMLTTPESFGEKVPYGGCSIFCNAKLKCGHPCPLPCHLYPGQPSSCALPTATEKTPAIRAT